MLQLVIKLCLKNGKRIKTLNIDLTCLKRHFNKKKKLLGVHVTRCILHTHKVLWKRKKRKELFIDILIKDKKKLAAIYVIHQNSHEIWIHWNVFSSYEFFLPSYFFLIKIYHSKNSASSIFHNLKVFLSFK